MVRCTKHVLMDRAFRTQVFANICNRHWKKPTLFITIPAEFLQNNSTYWSIDKERCRFYWSLTRTYRIIAGLCVCDIANTRMPIILRRGIITAPGSCFHANATRDTTCGPIRPGGPISVYWKERTRQWKNFFNGKITSCRQSDMKISQLVLTGTWASIKRKWFKSVRIRIPVLRKSKKVVFRKIMTQLV